MSTVVFNINDLINANKTLIAIEQNNKKSLELFNTNEYSNNLHSWASQSFPSSFKVYEYLITTPANEIGKYTCSDGEIRDIWAYIPFCLGYDIATYLNTIQNKFQGISITYSINNGITSSLCIHVTKV
jgi:hypothetical protein